MTGTIALRGVVHGKIIELDEELDLPDGQAITVSIQPAGRRLQPGEGIRRSAGAWADDAEGLDEYLEWNRQQRKTSRPPLEE